MRNEKRQVEQCRHSGPAGKSPPLDEVRDRRPAEDAEEHRGGGGGGGEPERASELGVGRELRPTFDAGGRHELGDRGDEKEEEQRAEEGGGDRRERTRQNREQGTGNGELRNCGIVIRTRRCAQQRAARTGQREVAYTSLPGTQPR